MTFINRWKCFMKRKGTTPYRGLLRSFLKTLVLRPTFYNNLYVTSPSIKYAERWREGVKSVKSTPTPYYNSKKGFLQKVVFVEFIMRIWTSGVPDLNPQFYVCFYAIFDLFFMLFYALHPWFYALFYANFNFLCQFYDLAVVSDVADLVKTSIFRPKASSITCK